MPTENEKLVEQVETLQRQMVEIRRQMEDVGPLPELAERITNIEESNTEAFALDPFTPDVSRSGDLMDVRKMPTTMEEEIKVLPFDIEHCVMKADASGTAATVVIRPTDEEGTEYASADDVEAFVANDRSPQLLEDRAWKKKSTATVSGQATFGDPESTITLSAGTFSLSMVGQWVKYDTSGNTYEIITYTDSTHADVTGDASSETNNDGITISGDILSFIRIGTTVSGVGGVLVGEARNNDPFLARIDQEDASGSGQYDEWAEVEADTETGGLKTVVGGRTHTSTGESLWESNGVTGIPTGTYVLVHIEDGDNILYGFVAPAGVENTSESMILDRWFDVQGNVGWEDFDTRDWRGRNVLIAGYWLDEESPTYNGDWISELVYHWSVFDADWVLQEDLDYPNFMFRIETNTKDAVQNLTKYDQGGNTDIWIRMNTDGHLQIQVTDYNSRTQVRFHAISGRHMDPADVVVIS